MFISFFFVLFLAVLWLLFILVPAKYRKTVLCIFSLGFCGYISLTALAALVLSTVVTFVGAIAIEKNSEDNKQAKAITVFTVALFAFVLIVFKNIPYLIKMFGFDTLSKNSILTSIVLPVGFSFYAFQAIGYLYDVYQGKETAEKDIVDFALYMGFFAKLVSGPIERKGRFADQLKGLAGINVIDRDRISLALTYMVWGYFLKLVIADRLALVVNQIHAAPEYFDIIWLIGGAIFYSFQVYTDFAGYTCIAIGCAMLFGIELTQNFKSPYCSKNITEFWRRWHISLSSWLKDYIYIPLGGNRKGALRKYFNTMVVFVLCGIWHGNGLTFLVWGILHGLFSIFDSVIGKRLNTEGIVRSFIARTATFIAVTFAWIFFRADSLRLALKYIKLMFTNGINPKGPISFIAGNGVVMLQVYISVAMIILVQIIDSICYRKKAELPQLIQENRMIKYGFVYVCLMAMFVIGVYGGAFKTETFIYMQF